MMMLCRCSSIMQNNKNNDLELVFTSLFLLTKLISKWYFPSEGKVGFFNFTVVFFFVNFLKLMTVHKKITENSDL